MSTRGNQLSPRQETLQLEARFAALLDAVPRPDPERQRKPVLAGEIPSILNPLPGCAFAMRCPLVTDRCRIERPMPQEVGAGHLVACHLA